jgi:hypothetical protein
VTGDNLFIAGLGVIILVLHGLVFPRLTVFDRYPKRLASDPDALRRFHRFTRRWALVAGLLIVLIGIL